MITSGTNQRIALTMAEGLVVAALLVIGLAQSARADSVTYTYTGNDFLNVAAGTLGGTGYYGTYSCPPECNITGSFTVAQALPNGILMSNGAVPPNQQLVLSSYDFTDGNTDWNSTNSLANEFIIQTTSTGGIAQWVISLSQDSGSLHYALFTTACLLPSSTGCVLPNNPNEDQTYLSNSTPNNPSPINFANNVSDPGTWIVTQTISPPPVPTPEPSSFLLLGTGLLVVSATLRIRARNQHNRLPA